MVLPPKPTTRRVERDADQRRGAAGDQLHLAPVHLERAAELTSTASLGRATSHGSWWCSRLSGYSRCQPFNTPSGAVFHFTLPAG